MAKLVPIKYIVNGKTVILRNAEIEDAEELVRIIRKIDTETRFLLREEDEFNLTIEQEVNFIQTKLESEAELLIIAEVDGKLVGTCGINGSSRKRLKHSANLGIAILRDYWGLSIGKRLIEAAIRWARDNSIWRITLQVDTDNLRAINLYLSLGFQVEGTLKKDKVLQDGSCIDTYTMALILR